ncbi:MAG: hypothetical protein KF768_08975 [Phycisphaeraceae bacterium]|nr:hypothetical protein [Phycisphaeraceae bacterium]
MRSRFAAIARPPVAAIILTGLLLLAGTGCAARSGSTGSRTGALPIDHPPTVREVIGDWNDVEAAALAGVDQAEATVRSVDRSRESDGVLIFDLLTVRDRSGELTVERISEGRTVRGVEHESARLRLTGRIGSGPLREPDTERWIIDRVARRLEQLRGVEFAPLR